jgi:hypothetical protein
MTIETDRDRRQRWTHLETSLSSLLSSLASQLDPASCEMVTEFIENREYAVALEWLADANSIRGIQLSNAQQAEFDRLAKLMGIDSTG